MPYGTRSRRPRRRTAGVRRRTFRRRAARPVAVPRPIMRSRRYTAPHSYKRVASSTDLNTLSLISTSVSGAGSVVLTGPFILYQTSNSIGPTYAGFGVAFTLAALPGAADFTTLYDKYKILGVSVKLFPVFAVGLASETVAAGGYFGGMIHSVLDYDDNSAPTASEAGLKELRERVGYRMNNMLATGSRQICLRRYFRPRIRIQVDSGAGTGKMQVNRAQWLDMQDVDIPHFGIKWLLEGYNSTLAQAVHTFKLDATYYIKCGGVR